MQLLKKLSIVFTLLLVALAAQALTQEDLKDLDETDLVLVPVSELRQALLINELFHECEKNYNDLQTDFNICEALGDSILNAYGLQVKKTQDAENATSLWFILFLGATSVAVVAAIM